MKAINSMNVEQLTDIMQSQLCLYGDKPLFVRGIEGSDTFMLSAAGEPVLGCASYYAVADDLGESGLIAVLERLSEIEPEELILCQREDIQASGFQIGIRTEEDGFVETICSKELLSGITLEVG